MDSKTVFDADAMNRQYYVAARRKWAAGDDEIEYAVSNTGWCLDEHEAMRFYDEESVEQFANGNCAVWAVAVEVPA